MTEIKAGLIVALSAAYVMIIVGVTYAIRHTTRSRFTACQ